MKKIVFFTGAGISAESGIKTFRDSADGLYLDTEIEGALTKHGWKYKKELVLDFHNKMRELLGNVKPNVAHLLIAALEKSADVTVITQNIDDLHERAGSTKVLHLHGELTKCRSTMTDEIYDAAKSINLGDKCPGGSQLRPHTVFFGEMPYNIDESETALKEADVLVIVGTSLTITYTPRLLNLTKAKQVYYIDPEPSKESELNVGEITYIEQTAVTGLCRLLPDLFV